VPFCSFADGYFSAGQMAFLRSITQGHLHVLLPMAALTRGFSNAVGSPVHLSSCTVPENKLLPVVTVFGRPCAMEISAQVQISFTPEAVAILNNLANAFFAAAGSPAALLNRVHDIADAPHEVAEMPAAPQPAAVTEPQQPEAPRKRRGRPPAAAKTAEQQTAAMSQQEAPPMAPPPGAAIPPGMNLSSGAVPPGITAPAMPVAAIPESGNGPSLDDLRQCIMEVNQKNNKAAFKVLRSRTWSDGTEKDAWYTAESVPPHLRERVIDDMLQAVA
jgi:hypothetical protein